MADAPVTPKKGSMVKIVLIGLAVLLGIFPIVVAVQPSEYTVTRSAAVAAPASAVFPAVNDLHRWQRWSPWEGLDPAMKRTYEGPAAGVNATYAWVGNDKVGEGRMTITDSKPNELVKMKLEFFKPMAGTSDVAFTFKEDGGKTTVTWAMSGKNNFVGKAFCLFMNMDKMLGGEFEKGLASLKTETEAKK
jgi:hypothetical protein